MSKSKKQITNYRVNQFEAEAARQACGPVRKPSDSIRQLIADGLRYKMANGKFTDKQISKPFLESKTSKEMMFFFTRHVDAASGENNVEGPLQNSNRFEQVPSNTKYAEDGKEVFVILGPNEVMADNGDIIVKW